jgi:hypothetical protein
MIEQWWAKQKKEERLIVVSYSILLATQNPLLYILPLSSSFIV